METAYIPQNHYLTDALLCLYYQYYSSYIEL